jgi:hypothetical protein
MHIGRCGLKITMKSVLRKTKNRILITVNHGAAENSKESTAAANLDEIPRRCSLKTQNQLLS